MAILAVGSTLFWSSDGVSYSELADLVSIGSPDPGAGPDVDVTPVNTSATTRSYLVGLRTGGDFEFEQLFTAARYSALDAVLGDQLYWKVRLPDGTTASSGSTAVFQGGLKKWSLAALDDPDKRVTILGAVKVSSDITFTEAT